MNKIIFNNITDQLIKEDDVVLGKMMSSPALKYNNKVFAFYNKEEMVFKLLSSKVLDDLGIKYELLNPFKTKPPLKGWFVVNPIYANQWNLLTKKALEIMKMS